MFDIQEARELLTRANVFFDCDPGDEDHSPGMAQTLDMSDTWGWASADYEYVPVEELPRVAELFCRYGNCGILYWVSERRNQMRSEFRDINRFIDFVRNEEAFRAKYPNDSQRAYEKFSYTLG